MVKVSLQIKSRFEAFDGSIRRKNLQIDQLKNISKHLQYRVDRILKKSYCGTL